MSEVEPFMISEERMNEIRRYFAVEEKDKSFFLFSDDKHQATCEMAAIEGIRDAFLEQLEIIRDTTTGYVHDDAKSAINAIHRRYNELLTEYENGLQTVILH